MPAAAQPLPWQINSHHTKCLSETKSCAAESQRAGSPFPDRPQRCGRLVSRHRATKPCPLPSHPPGTAATCRPSAGSAAELRDGAGEAGPSEGPGHRPRAAATPRPGPGQAPSRGPGRRAPGPAPLRSAARRARSAALPRGFAAPWRPLRAPGARTAARRPPGGSWPLPPARFTSDVGGKNQDRKSHLQGFHGSETSVPESITSVTANLLLILTDPMPALIL